MVITVLVDHDGGPVAVHQQAWISQGREKFGLHGTIRGGEDVGQVAVVQFPM